MMLTLGDFIYVFIIAGGALASALLTPVCRRLALSFGIVDKPDGRRKLQRAPVPYFGGVAIILGFLLASSVGMAAMGYMAKNYLIIASGALLMMIVGLVDDIIDMKSYIKFAAQILIATLTVVFGGAVEYITLFGHYISLGIFAAPITVIWIVLVSNAVNMMDGLDGLASGISAFALMALLVSALVSGDVVNAVICAALCGAALGFLPYNLAPASIFMGDAGALSLGYVMACVSAFGFFKGQAFFSLIAPALILALPVSDTVRLFFVRILHRRSPFSSDRMHIHHKLIDTGLSPRGAVMALYIISAMLSISAMVYIRSRIAAVIIAVTALALLGFIRFSPKLPKLFGGESVKASAPAENDTDGEGKA